MRLDKLVEELLHSDKYKGIREFYNKEYGVTPLKDTDVHTRFKTFKM